MMRMASSSGCGLTSIALLARERYLETTRLRQIAGVRPITALCYVLTLEGPTRFAASRSVGAYLGLCPRESQSGARSLQLRIAKAGDPMLRRLLVTSAHYVMGPFGPDTDLRRSGLALAARGGTMRRSEPWSPSPGARHVGLLTDWPSHGSSKRWLDHGKSSTRRARNVIQRFEAPTVPANSS